MNFKFQNLLGASYRGGNVTIVDNTLLISPVGNRISLTDLKKSKTITLPCEYSSNITRIAVSNDGVFLLTIDENNFGIFINLRCRAVIHRISFKKPVGDVKFSPDGTLVAVATGKLVQIWRSPGSRKGFLLSELLRTFTDCKDQVTALDWSSDSKYLLVGSKDMSVRLFCLKKGIDSSKPFEFRGHRDRIVGVFFATDKLNNNALKVYTLSRDGAIFSWIYNDGDVNKRKRKNVKGDCDDEYEDLLHKGKWELLKQDCFMQPGEKLTACNFHSGLDLVVMGLSSGAFGLYKMPDFTCIHVLSISREKITTATFNGLGNWLIFGCAELGQLLVWDWESEIYILKQQGHFFNVNCLAYSPDSQLMATDADDNKIKVWTVSSGFCVVTFSAHTNAVTALHFMPKNHGLLSASLDGTVRAWDLFHYRNFRTFTTPSSKEFVSLAADHRGEVICAGTSDSYEICVWSMKTGRLLDVLRGHQGPVNGLTFSPIHAILASSSWDKTVRLWDIFHGKVVVETGWQVKGLVETFWHSRGVVTVVYKPNGKELACSTFDGTIHFWDIKDGLRKFTIEGRRDIDDCRSAANSTSRECFTSLCYTVDGDYILAGGSSKYIFMYHVTDKDQELVRRFQITHNLSRDGFLDFFDSMNLTDASLLNLIDDNSSDTQEGVDKQPRDGRPVIQTKCLRIAPTGRSWAAATTEGVLVYSIDDSFTFVSIELDVDVTPEAVDTALSEGHFARALIISLLLNEDALIKRCIITVFPADIPAVVSSVPMKYLQRLIEALAELLEKCPHLELILRWSQELCKVHGTYIQQNSINLLPALKSLEKAITRKHQDMAEICSSNEYMLRYLCSSSP